MSRYLVNFGDSWANGPGGPHINNPCYAAQLSRMTDRRFVDLSQPSTTGYNKVICNTINNNIEYKEFLWQQ